MGMREKTMEKYETAKRLIEGGMLIDDACRNVGWSQSKMYYNIRKRLESEKDRSANLVKKRPTSISYDVVTTQIAPTNRKMIFAIGSIDDVKELMNHMGIGR